MTCVDAGRAGPNGITLRFARGPASGVAGAKGGDLAGGGDHSAAKEAQRRSVRQAGSFTQSGKEAKPALPWYGNGPLQ